MFDLILACIEEVSVTTNGGDFGLGATADLLFNGNEDFARMFLNLLAP